jgi:hypothetical protein
MKKLNVFLPCLAGTACLLLVCACGLPAPPYHSDTTRYHLFIGSQEWDALLEDPFADVEVEAFLEVHGTGYIVGVELHGATGRKYDKLPIKLKFHDKTLLIPDPFQEGSELTYDKLILKAMYKDQSMLREALAFEVARHIGMDAPKTAFARLFLNDHDWGLYTLVEPMDMDYIRHRGFMDGGNLYKAVEQQADFRPDRDLQKGFEKKSNRDHPWDDLDRLVFTLQNTETDKDAFLEDIDPVFNLDRYIQRMIWVSYTQNTDGVSQNFYLYNEPNHESNHWLIIPWDSDICFSNHWDMSQSTYAVDLAHLLDGGNYFSRRLVRIDEIRHAYVDRFKQKLGTVLSAEEVAPIAEEMFAAIQDDLAHDLDLWNRTSSVGEEYDEIREFIEKRPLFLLKRLREFQDNPDIPDPIL